MKKRNENIRWSDKSDCCLTGRGRVVVVVGPLYQFGMIGLANAFTGFKFGVFTGIAALILLGRVEHSQIGTADR